MNPTDLPSRWAVQVRAAVLSDLPGMARVHVNGWITTYRGMIPDEILDHLTVDRDIASGFGQGLKEPTPGAEQLVAVTEAGEIVGYVRAGPDRDRDASFDGELEALYVLDSHRGHGVGTALVQAAARFLITTGRRSMIVWVLEGNPYRRFYERLGGVYVRSRLGTAHRLGGGPLPEVSYGWRDLRSLVRM